MPLEACTNNSTDVLLSQLKKHLNVDSHYKVRVTLFVENQYGEILKECKKQFSPSYYKRGIRKWFFNHGITKREEIEIKPAGQNRVIAIATYATC